MAAITATPKSVRPHLMVAEIDSDFGRHWSEPMFKVQLDLWIDRVCAPKTGNSLSDYCCANGCWCSED